MRTTVLLVIVLLTMGLAWGPAPVVAGDKAVMQLPQSCQPVTDAELAQLSGKQGNSFDLCQVARCIYSHLPPNAQRKVACVVRVINCINPCKTNGTTPTVVTTRN